MVTLRRIENLPSLRSVGAFAVLLPAFVRAAERPGFRLTCFSVQSNHVHLIVEAEDGEQLARGLQGLQVRMARALNRAWARRGSVFEGQYHCRALRTPRAVRHALVYVLQNARKHGVQLEGLDPCSSARWFRGWSARVRFEPVEGASPVVQPCTWLLRVGWLRHGLLDHEEAPRSHRARRGASHSDPHETGASAPSAAWCRRRASYSERDDAAHAPAAWARGPADPAVRARSATGAA